MTADLLAVLRELVALVRGECPQLLDEDRDGDANLSMRIDSALRAITESAEAPVAWIPKCDFDGMATGRVGRAFGPQPDLLKSRDNCVPVYTHPAPLPAVAGVTEAMVETFEAKFLECARTRPDSTLRDDIRAALVAALGAREGK